MSESINIIIPEFLRLQYLWDELYKLMNLKKPYKIFDDRYSIMGIYGSFPSMVWNGGNTHVGERYSEEKIDKIFSNYDSKNIDLMLTCSNTLLTKEHLNDNYCNKILDIANYHKNCIIMIVNNDLRDYISKNYPNVKLCRSLIANYVYGLDIDYDKYDYFVIDQFKNKDFDYLKKVEYKDKAIIHVNQKCVNNCPNILKHYNLVSKINLMNSNHRFNCEKASYDSFVYPEELDKYLEIGFTNFKFNDRNIQEIKTNLRKILDFICLNNYRSDVYEYLISYVEKRDDSI